MMHSFLMILPIFALAAMQADDRKADSSIVPSKAPTISSKVENGAVYDKTSISVKDLDMVVIPDNARLVQEGNGKEIQIFMVKTLSFAGHPPKPITLRHVRQNMGVASQADGKTILLATFGEWDSKREGAARMEMLIIAPKGIRVAKRSKHSGENSVANVQGDAPRKRPNEGYWYGAATRRRYTCPGTPGGSRGSTSRVAASAWETAIRVDRVGESCPRKLHGVRRGFVNGSESSISPTSWRGRCLPP